MVMRYKRRKWILSLGNFSPACVCVCLCVLYEMTDVPDYNLCPTKLWTPVYPHKILQDNTVQHRPDLLDPKGSLSPSVLLLQSVLYFLHHPLTHSQIHTYRTNHHPKGPERKREKWFLSFFSFNWGSAAISVTDPLRGGHQTKEKPFTLYCLSPQRAHTSFLTL